MRRLMYVSPTKANLLELASLPKPRNHDTIPAERAKLWHARLEALHLPSRILLAKLNYETNISKNRNAAPSFFVPDHPEGRYFKMAVRDFEELRRVLLIRLGRSARTGKSLIWID